MGFWTAFGVFSAISLHVLGVQIEASEGSQMGLKRAWSNFKEKQQIQFVRFLGGQDGEMVATISDAFKLSQNEVGNNYDADMHYSPCPQPICPYVGWAFD